MELLEGEEHKGDKEQDEQLLLKHSRLVLHVKHVQLLELTHSEHAQEVQANARYREEEDQDVKVVRVE